MDDAETKNGYATNPAPSRCNAPAVREVADVTPEMDTIPSLMAYSFPKGDQEQRLGREPSVWDRVSA
jgi:hypothetical protein